jgi:myo-inositol-1(or 4)-monophosphatase
MNARLQTAIRAARAAGKILHEKFDRPLQIKSKGKRDIVTDADFAADHILRDMILARFPNDVFLSEEDDAAKRAQMWADARDGKISHLWVADPLDGTTNYAHSLPLFCTSIALVCGNQVELGVIVDPLRNECYAAERGHGATLNGKPIHVTASRKLEEAVIGTEWARDQKLRLQTSAVFNETVARAITGRALGSAALTLCYLATGRIDTYVHLSLSPWDIAAAALIVEEAGGRVTSPDGKPWTVHSKSYVATNKLLHARLLKFFR